MKKQVLSKRLCLFVQVDVKEMRVTESLFIMGVVECEPLIKLFDEKFGPLKFYQLRHNYHNKCHPLVFLTQMTKIPTTTKDIWLL